MEEKSADKNPSKIFSSTKKAPSIFLGFLYELRRFGFPVGLGASLDFYRGLAKGLVTNLEELFDLAALCFVKRPSQMDRFERAFVRYFFGIELPEVAEGDLRLLETPEFRSWLSQAILKGEVQPVVQNLSPEDLMRRFWETLRKQTEAHHGGSRWIGTAGNSPFGHSGQSLGGIRVLGESKNRSASKVFGSRRYIDYSEDAFITEAPISQILRALKRLRPVGASARLDIPETIYRSAKNAGEIEFVFERELRDRLELIVFLDNGGSSMLPFVELCRELFLRLKRELRACDFYYFHNTIYDSVFVDPARRRPRPLAKVFENYNEPVLLIIGDASMNPYELGAAWGAIDPASACAESSLFWLDYLKKKSLRSVWLNPIPKRDWEAGAPWSLQKIREIFYMEDLSLRGLKEAVRHLAKEA